MPKPYTAPFLIDQAKTLTTAFLSKTGFFKENCKVIGTTGWTSNKSKDLDIVITTIMEKGKERIRLAYFDFNDVSVVQTIFLKSRPSNLGKGVIWHFICPYNKTICRKLVFANNRFMHRSNVKGGMYTKQTESKYWRKIFQLQPNIIRARKILDEPLAKNYKTFYDGKITKRYEKHLKTTLKWLENRDKRNQLIRESIHKIKY